jgi:hypothetical protein
MGTRNLTMVLRNNEIKVAQYCQWDGHFDSQGKTVFEFITKEMKQEQFTKAIEECRFLTELEVSYRLSEIGINSDWINLKQGNELNKAYPALSRDPGAKILELIQNENIRELVDNVSFASNSLFCEYAYLIDLDNNLLEVYSGFQKLTLTDADRFNHLTSNPNLKSGDVRYYPIIVIKTFTFKELKNISFDDYYQELTRLRTENYEQQDATLKAQEQNKVN